jgi:hypothetical protein
MTTQERMTRIESLKTVRKFVDEELKELGVHTPVPLPPRPAPPDPIPPLPVGEVDTLRNSNSWMAMTLTETMRILGQTDGTMKDLTAHARKVVAELNTLRKARI